MSFTLGTLTIDHLTAKEGPNYRQTAQRVAILSDGTSARNEVLQQGALPALEWRVTGFLESSSDVATLRGYYASHDSVEWIDPTTSDDLNVRVFELALRQVGASVWSFDATLLESDELLPA